MADPTEPPADLAALYYVTDNALGQYRDNFDRAGDRHAVRALAHAGVPAPAWVRKAVASRTEREVRVAGETVLVLAPNARPAGPPTAVVAVLTLAGVRLRPGVGVPRIGRGNRRPVPPDRRAGGRGYRE